MGFVFGTAFLGASLTVALAWLWFRDLELALLLAPTGGILAALVVFVARVVAILMVPRSTDFQTRQYLGRQPRTRRLIASMRYASPPFRLADGTPRRVC
jgi:hypothetical protein